MGPLLITPHLPFKIVSVTIIKMFARDLVQGLIWLFASRSKIKPNVKVSLL